MEPGLACIITRFFSWFRGQDSDGNRRKWVFEGVEGEEVPMELSGLSVGKSSIVHVLDVFGGGSSEGRSPAAAATCGVRHHPFVNRTLLTTPLPRTHSHSAPAAPVKKPPPSPPFRPTCHVTTAPSSTTSLPTRVPSACSWRRLETSTYWTRTTRR